jgi:hypothetical protein
MHKQIAGTQLANMLALTNATFEEDIAAQNAMYKLPANDEPTLDNLVKPDGSIESPVSRLKKFRKTLLDEVDESDLIESKLAMIDEVTNGAEYPYTDDTMNGGLLEFAELVERNVDEAKRQVLVDIADWLADITVYVHSEALKFGIPLTDIQKIVMGSNFTKLPDSGVPIYDENGKFLKDKKNFRPPEDGIYTYLFHRD